MNSNVRDSVGFAAIGIAFAALFLGISSCAARDSEAQERRAVACIKSGGQTILGNCVRGDGK